MRKLSATVSIGWRLKTLTDSLKKHFSEFSEAYAVPGDVTTKGADFLREAESLWDDERGEVKLATLQGALLLYDRSGLTTGK
jgi:hypothetical protein